MEKLIRDKVRDIPHPDYPNMTTRLVRNIYEHIDFLSQKKDEEINEFNNARGEKKIKEAADVLEVLDTLIQIWMNEEKYIKIKQDFLYRCEYQCLDIETILETQKQKKEEKWGFEKGIIWIYE